MVIGYGDEDDQGGRVSRSNFRGDESIPDSTSLALAVELGRFEEAHGRDLAFWGSFFYRTQMALVRLCI